MAVGTLGKQLALQNATDWKGLTKTNHLLQVFRQGPQQSNIFVQMLAAERISLDTILNQYPTMEFDEDIEYTWNLATKSRKNIPLIEARDEDGQVVTASTVTVGAGGARFTLVFPQDWFGRGMRIVGNYNEKYPIRIVSEPRYEGTNTCYECELMGVSKGIPGKRLLAGERFSIEFYPVSAELSRRVGEVHHSAPISMRNEFTNIRFGNKVAGSMLHKKVGLKDVPLLIDGKKTTQNLWMFEEEWKFNQEWNEQKNNVLLYGTSNRNENGEYTNVDFNGEVIRMGSGLREQLEVSNIHWYSKFSLKAFTNKIVELCAGKIKYGDRKFVVTTGEYGMMQAQQAILTEGSGWKSLFEFDANESGLVTKTTNSSAPHGGALRLTTPQFTEFVAPNGALIQFIVDPRYDDDVRNKILHPNGGVAESYRYDIMDFGPKSEPNIVKVGVKNKPELRGFQWGPFANPFTGATGNSSASWDEDSAEIHVKATMGILVKDPTRTVSLIHTLLRG